MKILKIYPKIDNPSRYNYHINYGVWDAIDGDNVILEEFNSNINSYDVVFLPMYKRWVSHVKLLNKLKKSKVKTILFDNDSQYREFNSSFYDGLDFVFYRSLDKKNNKPKTKNDWLMWSVDTMKYKPKYGGKNISFNCTVNSFYKSRYEIKKNLTGIIKHTNYRGKNYIKHLQDSAAAIHSSPRNDRVYGKLVEFAACGTQIISSKSTVLSHYYPEDLIIIYNSISELSNLVKNFQPNIDIQKELRLITETKHDNNVRAKEILNKIEEIL